jgi:hypothetical protein
MPEGMCCPDRAAWGLDMAVWRSFVFKERRSLDVRAAAFNAINDVQYGKRQYRVERRYPRTDHQFGESTHLALKSVF